MHALGDSFPVGSRPRRMFETVGKRNTILSGATINLVQAQALNDDVPRQNDNWDGRHSGDWKSHETNRSEVLPRLSLAGQDADKERM